MRGGEYLLGCLFPSVPEVAALPTFTVYQNQKYNKDCKMIQQTESKKMQKNTIEIRDYSCTCTHVWKIYYSCAKLD